MSVTVAHFKAKKPNEIIVWVTVISKSKITLCPEQPCTLSPISPLKLEQNSIPPKIGQSFGFPH